VRGSSSNTGGGLGFCTVLFLIFLVLKLTDTISWSWWWVTAPLWGSVALGVVIIVVVFIVSAIVVALHHLMERKADR